MKIEIFGSNWCEPCRNAKKLLEKLGKEYTFFDVTDNQEHYELFTEKFNGKRPATIPQIFINEEHIGGYDNLKEYFK